jgi:tetratricopeptide (TPR) repeat protein
METPASSPAALTAWRSLLLAQAAAHARAGELAPAEACAASAVEADSGDVGNAEALCLLGKIQAQRGALDRARTSLRAALAADPAHAQARAALDCIEADGLRRHRRALGALGALGALSALGVATLALLAVGSAWWAEGARGQPEALGGPAVPQPASAPAVSARGGSDAAPAPPTEQIERFAAFVAGLQRFSPHAQVQAHAVAGPAGLAARLSGSVPTEHVRQALRAHAAAFAPLPVQDEAVVLEPRYTVRRGDSLSSIAGRLYGSPAHWTRLRDANAGVVGDGQRIEVGTVLDVP